jgi:hypothetical protein
MGLKRFKDNFGDTGFMKGWEDEVKDLMVEIRANEVVEVRFVGLFLAAHYHWVPFMSKKRGRMSFFPQMCLDWDIKESNWSGNEECPACDLEDVGSQEYAISPVIMVDTLLDGDVDNALKIFKVGPRERTKIANLQKYNKVDGIPTDVADLKNGKGVLVLNDPDQKDPANRWQFNLGRRLQIRLINEDTQVQVRIPKKADSPLRGEVVTLDIPDLEEIVWAPKAKELQGKYKRMKVDEAMPIYLKQNKKRDEDRRRDDDDDDRGRGRRRSRDDDDDDRGRGRRRSRDDDDDGGRRRGRSRGGDSPRSRQRKDADEDGWGGDDSSDDSGSDEWGDEGEEEQERRPRQRQRRRPKEDEEPRGRRGKKTGKKTGSKKQGGKTRPRKPPCYGHMGEEDTEDCTICKVRGRCSKAS